jgi:hypothetical protein
MEDGMPGVRCLVVRKGRDAPRASLPALLLLVALMAAPADASRNPVCALLLEVETDAADALEGGALPAPRLLAERADEILALARDDPQIQTGMIRLARVYRAAGDASLLEFGQAVLDTAQALRLVRSDCGMPSAVLVMSGEAVTHRPATGRHEPPMSDAEAFRIIRTGDVDQRTTWSVIAAIAAVSAAGLFLQWLWVGRRTGAPRHACELRATVETPWGEGTTVVEDVSRFGARVLRRGLPLEPGHRVELRCAHFTRRARVRWCNEHFFGVLFPTALPKEVVAAIVAEAEAAAAAREEGEAATGNAPARPDPATV